MKDFCCALFPRCEHALLSRRFTEEESAAHRKAFRTFFEDDPLRKRVADAEEALRFYADRESWNIAEVNGAAGFINSVDFDNLGFGGTKAREFFERYRD